MESDDFKDGMTPTTLRPEIINAGIAYDDRGSVTFANEFDFSGIKRFYQVENLSLDIIRAFHGHKKEGKYVFVSKGSAKIICAKMENGSQQTGSPKNIRLHNPVVFTVNSKKPVIIKIPPGFANGFRALETGTTIIFFSTSSLEESKGDDYRFPWNVFGKEIWQTENR